MTKILSENVTHYTHTHTYIFLEAYKRVCNITPTFAIADEFSGKTYRRLASRRCLSVARQRAETTVIDKLSPNLLSARRLWPRVDPRVYTDVTRAPYIHRSYRAGGRRRVVNRRGCRVTRSWHRGNISYPRDNLLTPPVIFLRFAVSLRQIL